jgi:hypothetical protein
MALEVCRNHNLFGDVVQMKGTCIYVEDLVYYDVVEFYLKKLLYSQRGGTFECLHMDCHSP